VGPAPHIHAALLAAGAAAALPRVALYVGAGSSPGSGGNLTVALQRAAATGVIASVDLFQGADVGARLNKDDYDVVVFPGGGGSAEAAGIGAAGAAAVKCVRGGLQVCCRR
jgi:hypothetical protein